MKTFRCIHFLLFFCFFFQYFLSIANSSIIESKFIRNIGQLDENTIAFRRASQCCSFFQSQKVIHQLYSSFENRLTVVNIEFDFLEVNTDVSIYPELISATKSNFLFGSDPEMCFTGVDNFDKLSYKNFYEKIDVIYYSDSDRLKSDIIIHSGGELSNYKFKIKGNQGITINDNQELEIITAIGLIKENIPEAYQIINNKKIKVNLNYHIDNEGVVSFKAGKYDKNHDLVIDPELCYLSYFGGIGDDYFLSGNVEKDNYGNMYFTGRTISINLPTTPGVIGPINSGGYDACVVKLDKSGQNVLFSTYLGGPNNDYGYCLKLIGSNNDIVITGDAGVGFPVTSGSYQTEYQGGPYDVFITRINNTGDAIVFSTFLGGSEEDQPFQLHIDNQDNICVVGQTSGSFPVSPNAYQTTNGGWYDIFITKLNASGSLLLASTYIGSSNADRGVSITTDNQMNIYITGIVQGVFPITLGAYDNSFNGGNYDIVACKFNPSLTDLLYSTYIGTVGDDIPRGKLILDEFNNLVITGKAGQGFIHSPTTYQSVFGGGNSDGIIVKLSYDGSAIINSTYLGGVGDDFIQNIQVAPDFNLFITGSCGSGFPVTQCCYDDTFNGGLNDCFISVINTSLSQLLYSSFFGGNNIDQGMAINLIEDTVFILGETKSPNLPTTPGAYDPSYNGGYDIFLMKLLMQGGQTASVFAGNDMIVCSDQLPVVLNEATATNAASIQWTTTGTGNFNNNSLLNPSYSPSQSDINAGMVFLIITPNVGTACEGMADTLILTINNSAVVNAGPDVSICQSGSCVVNGASAQNASSVLWTHNGFGSLISPNSLTPTYQSSPEDISDVTLTMTGYGNLPCTSEQDQLIIHIQLPPATFAGFDTTICSQIIPILLADSYCSNSSSLNWTTSGTGSFNNPNILHPTYTPSLGDLSSGSITLSLLCNGISPCQGTSDFLVVNFSAISAGLAPYKSDFLLDG